MDGWRELALSLQKHVSRLEAENERLMRKIAVLESNQFTNRP